MWCSVTRKRPNANSPLLVSSQKLCKMPHSTTKPTLFSFLDGMYGVCKQQLVKIFNPEDKIPQGWTLFQEDVPYYLYQDPKFYIPLIVVSLLLLALLIIYLFKKIGCVLFSVEGSVDPPQARSTCIIMSDSFLETFQNLFRNGQSGNSQVSQV